MYKLYTDPTGSELLNMTTVNYSRNVHTQQYFYGGRVGHEPAGYSWSDLRLEGPCDSLADVFFFRLSSFDVNDNPISTFYIFEDESDFSIKISGGFIHRWQYTDSEDNRLDTFSLTLGVTDIQRLTSKKIEKKSQKKVKEKKVIIPERQIVICRIH